VLLDLDDHIGLGSAANPFSKSSESVRRVEQVVHLAACHQLVQEPLRGAQLKSREPQKRCADSHFQLVNPLLVGLEAADEVLKPYPNSVMGGQYWSGASF